MRARFLSLVLVFIILESCQENIKLQQNNEIQIKEAFSNLCECKGRSGITIDSAFRRIMSYKDYEAGIISDSPVNFEATESFLKTDFANNRDYMNCIQGGVSLLSQPPKSYIEKNNRDSLIRNYAKNNGYYYCFKVLPILIEMNH